MEGWLSAWPILLDLALRMKIVIMMKIAVKTMTIMMKILEVSMMLSTGKMNKRREGRERLHFDRRRRRRKCREGEEKG